MYTSLFLFLYTFLLACPSLAADPWFPGPFNTDGRWIVNAKGDRLTYAGANWPGAADTMVPEGLQYASIPALVGKIKSVGMNAIRLTWAVEMVDDILDNGGDVEIKTAFTTVLGVQNGTKVFDAVMKNNPTFAPNVTRLQVFDAIAQECAHQQIYVHLDNHVSKAGWCCSGDDGNAWFGDKYFDTTKWERALGYMADHGKSWPALVSMSLRNELRRSSDWKQFIFYNWGFWYDNMTAGAAAIYKANPDLLIFFSGENYDSRLRPIFSGGSMGVNRTFNKSGFDYADKIVLEVHDYDMDSNCTTKTSKLTENAFAALDKSDPAVEDLYPVVMSEWGYAQSLDQYTAQYASCLRQILPRKYIGWMTWALAGSYYVRSGTQDMDEPWGLLDHEWKDWRCPTCVTQGLGPMAAASLGGGKVVDARTF